MKRILPVEELARDERFVRIKIEDVVFDPRNAARADAPRNRLKPSAPEAPDGARALMHGIFMGEIQALEGAGVELDLPRHAAGDPHFRWYRAAYRRLEN